MHYTTWNLVSCKTKLNSASSRLKQVISVSGTNFPPNFPNFPGLNFPYSRWSWSVLGSRLPVNGFPIVRLEVEYFCKEEYGPQTTAAALLFVAVNLNRVIDNLWGAWKVLLLQAISMWVSTKQLSVCSMCGDWQRILACDLWNNEQQVAPIYIDSHT